GLPVLVLTFTVGELVTVVGTGSELELITLTRLNVDCATARPAPVTDNVSATSEILSAAKRAFLNLFTANPPCFSKFVWRARGITHARSDCAVEGSQRHKLKSLAGVEISLKVLDACASKWEIERSTRFAFVAWECWATMAVTIGQPSLF